MPDQFTTAASEITFSSDNPPTLDIEARLDPARTAIGPYSTTMVILAKTGLDPCAWLSFEIPIRAEVQPPSAQNLVRQWNMALAERASSQRKTAAQMEKLRDTASSALKMESQQKTLGPRTTAHQQQVRIKLLSAIGTQAYLAENTIATESIPANRSPAALESPAQTPPPPPPPPPPPEAEQTPAASSSGDFTTMSANQAQATATPDLTQKPGGPYWNSVISPLNRDHIAVADLVVGCQYKIHFDVAAFDYSLQNLFAAVTSSVPVNSILKTYVGAMQNSGPIELQTVPFNFGAVRFTTTTAPATISIDTHKLLDTHPSLPTTDSLADFATAANAGRYTVTVVAGSDNTAAAPHSGCGSVGISLWSPEGPGVPPQPMGYVVRYLRVADSTGRFPAGCANQNVGGAAAPANLINKLPLQGDATLYVFRLNEPARSVAVFQSPERPAETWLLEQDPEDSLSSRIDQANVIDAATSGLGGKLEAEPPLNTYHQIYEGIELDLFSAFYETQKEAPKSALKIIRDIAKNKAAQNQRARFVVLISGENGREIFYPAGLLSDGGSPPKPLAMTADFVEELPSQTIQPSCIRTPKKDLMDIVRECHLDQVTVPPSIEFSSLKSDLSGPHTPELLLLLAHQGKGNLSMRDKSDLLHPADLGPFEANSAGILLTCNPDVNDLKLGSNWPLEFNRKGMGALIFSPFLVPEDFAACFASVLSKEMDEAASNNKPTTLSGLYRNAIERLRNAGWKKRSEIAYQFIFAGDVELPLCK